MGIAHPVIQAPMAGGWTTPALVAAVANAGGLGNLALYRASLAADGDWAPLLAGQGLRMARRVQPAAEIVAELVERLDRVISFAGP